MNTENFTTTNNILLTGVTGFIGRHVLYELLRERLESASHDKIFVTVRNTETCAEQRVRALFCDGACPDYLQVYPIDLLISRIEILALDLRDNDLAEQLNARSESNIYVLHCAASTNLANSESVEREVQDNNITASMNLLKAVQDKVKKFVYISSSFASGNVAGEITDDYLSTLAGTSRNPYEKAKILVESELSKYCDALKIDWQILRPSVVCGRLHDAPLNYASKFDVFYGFAKCFAHFAKRRHLGSPIRVLCHASSSVNIVPVDYVAKVITKAYTQPIRQLNIVHHDSVPARELLKTIFGSVNFENYTFVDEMPSELSREERFYYSSAGAIFTCYLTAPTQWFNTQRIQTLMDGVTPPPLLDALPGLLDYAMACQFDPASAAKIALVQARQNRARRIVLVGSGYVAIHAYRSLASRLRRELETGAVEICVISNNNYHAFHGFIGEVVAGVLPLENIFTPIRQIFPKANIIQGMVSNVNAAQNMLHYNDNTGLDHSIDFDELVLATGSVDDNDKIKGLSNFGWSVRQLNALIQLRQHIVQTLELAQSSHGNNDIEKALTFVVAGAGFTGVELCTALAYQLESCKPHYPILHKFRPRLILVHAGDEILPDLQEKYASLIHYTKKQLDHYNIELKLNTRLTEVNKQSALCCSGERIPTYTVLSTVGHRPVVLNGTQAFPRDALGRVKADPFLHVQGYDNIWTGGDSAHVLQHNTSSPCPSNAIWAMKHGQRMGKNIALKLKGKNLKPFTFPGLGQAASFGGNRCISELFGFQFTGWIAKVARLSFFLYYMPSRRGALQNMLEFSVNRILGKKLTVTTDVTHRKQKLSLVETQSKKSGEASYASL